MIESVVKKDKASSSSPLIPFEINAHLERFGKESWEVDYNLFGYCACGGAAD